MRVARNIGLIGLAVVMVACSDAKLPTSSTEPPAPYEGAKVSMTGTSTILVPGLNGQVISATTHEWATDAIVTDGLAQAAQSRFIQDPNAAKMPVLYMSDAQASLQGPRNHRQIVPWKDSKGSTGDFAFITGDAGPVKTMIHIGASRQVEQAYSFEWKKVRGGWLATAFTTTLFKNGKVVLQVRSASKGVAPRGPTMMYAADDPCWSDMYCEPADYREPGIPGGTWGGNLYGPTGCCASQLNDYLIAAGLLANAQMACAASMELPCLNPNVAIGLGILATAAGIYLWRYRSCWNASPCYQGRPSASIGGSAPPPDSFWLPKQYFRPSAVPV
jgi:hypothetical protein